MAEQRVTLSTPLIEVPRESLANLTINLKQKLAAAVASAANKTDPETATVEDLLSYLPSRYEDRSNFLSLDKLDDGIEAAVELYSRNATGRRVGRNRDPRKPPLFLFELIAGDRDRLMPP
ncbi:MAG: hypothetical protein KBD94_07595, partial [Pyrinomonadaceae bacterium]|nr:hypothetical protein [Pyrinomonadaceae bacterium]